MPIKTSEEEKKKKAENSQLETKIETHARNTNPKHKHSPKHKAETQAQLETQSPNVENREERSKWVRSAAEHGFAVMGLWWLGSCRLTMGL